jgi:hypothetical protein
MYLEKLREQLKLAVRLGINYAVPRQWMPEGYKGHVSFDGKIFKVNPYEFYLQLVEEAIGGNYSSSVPDGRNMYVVFPRSTAAYNHKGFGLFEPDDIFGYRESGTFLKMIPIALHARQMHFGTIYLLPISSYSNRFKKGTIGSPYAVSDPLSLSEDLADPLVDLSAEEQFSAFVEFCHRIGLKVVLDFVPRTAARDSALLLDHPDWFYWIDVDSLSKYGPPKAPEMGFRQLTNDDMAYLYGKQDVREFLKCFKPAPSTTDPQRWDNFVEASRGKDFLPELVKTFGVITPPGFSDWLNDPQPTWDDVTFYRLYLDHPDVAKPFVASEQPPYVLFDVIKSSNFPGSEPNADLWDFISNIIRSYVERFDIDGARIDMGHALPKILEQKMISNVLSIKPNFLFIAEELNPSGDIKAKESNYNAIIGNIWWMLPREEKIVEAFLDSSTRVLPVWGAVETPDTPRIFGRLPKDEALQRLILSAFLPNSYFVLNAGVEIEEKQPMNLGLDATLDDKWILPKDDEFYGKLAFFDHYVLHWDSKEDMTDFVTQLNRLRIRYYDPNARVTNTEPLMVKHNGALLVWNNTVKPIYYTEKVLISAGVDVSGALQPGSVALLENE